MLPYISDPSFLFDSTQLTIYFPKRRRKRSPNEDADRDWYKKWFSEYGRLLLSKNGAAATNSGDLHRI